MTAIVSAYVCANDRLIEYGLRAQLQDVRNEEIRLVSQPSQADVAILATIDLTEHSLTRVGQLVDGGCGAVLIICREVDLQTLASLIAVGANGVLRSGEVTPSQLREVVLAAASGGGAIPYDLVGELLTGGSLGFHQLHNLGENIALDEREELVIRLLANGRGTLEIAEELHYSERTIKTVVHGVIRRFGLRNRPHAVAFAIRRGLI